VTDVTAWELADLFYGDDDVELDEQADTDDDADLSITAGHGRNRGCAAVG